MVCSKLFHKFIVLKTICSTEWMRKSHRVQKMMAKRGAGGESVLIKVNIPIKYLIQ